MKSPLPKAEMDAIKKIVNEQDQWIEFPYRAKVVAPHGHSSTNGYCYRYFLTFEEAARCPGRKGIPEYAPGNAKGKRPEWLKAAQREYLARPPKDYTI